MLGILFAGLRKKHKLEEMVEAIQDGDLELRNDLIDRYRPFIKKSVSSVCKRYIRDTDDEFSIGLIAFNDAIDKFSSEKGTALLSFADTMIKRRVIDYLRYQNKKRQEFSLEYNGETEEDGIQNIFEADKSMQYHHDMIENENRKEEILRFISLLQTFDISFENLVQQSPKHFDARKNAVKIAKIVADHPLLLTYLMEKKKLPLKMLEEKVEVSRKTIERNRIYIIAMCLIFSGDYVFLYDYLKGVMKS